MIYFIQCNDYVKVGYTSNLKSRMKDYVTENPYPTKLLHILNGGYDIERKIHKQLKKFKHRGEWFLYTAEVKDKIAFIIAENKSNVEPSKSKAKRDKYRHLTTLMLLKEAANGAGFIVLDKKLREKIRETVDVTIGTIRNHLIKLEKLKRITRTDSTIFFT